MQSEMKKTYKESWWN